MEGRMKFTKLEDEQREFFDRNGYLVVRNALDSDMLKLVTAACDRIVEQRCDGPSGRKSVVNVLPDDENFNRYLLGKRQCRWWVGC